MSGLPQFAPEWLTVLGERPHRYFARIGSTNDEAATWALAGAQTGAVVLADEQIAGRGRHGRSWLAAPGSSLLLSIILRPDLPPAFFPRVTLLGAVALADVLAGLGLQPQIKWPNDVLLKGRKTAGILAETVWAGEQWRAVVLGMGINVYRHALPAGVDFAATTIETALCEAGDDPQAEALDRAALLARLLSRLDFYTPQLAEPALLDAWRGYNITLGRQVTVRAGERVWHGLAEAIDEQGALLLRTAAGEQRRLLAGEVTLHGLVAE